jgi:hypothetical protein
MSVGKDKDIVQEVFGRSMKVDDRASALFGCIERLSQVSAETARGRRGELNGSVGAKEGNCENASKGTKKQLSRQVWTIAAGGLVLFGLVFFASSSFMQDGSASTGMVPEQQYVKLSETVSPPEKAALGNVESENVQAEAVSEKIDKTITSLDLRPVIDWGRLLSEISATMPRTIHLNVIESADGSEMFLGGAALSADAVLRFVGSLSSNRQVTSTKLTKTDIGQRNSEDMFIFLIRCSLVSDTETAGSFDGGDNNSWFDKSRLFTPQEAEKFFGSINPVSERTGCVVKSLLFSAKDGVFEDSKTNSRITQKHAVLTLQGGYQNIMKAATKLQNHSQGVWFDSVSIKQDSESGGLECSMGISVYVADGAG